MLALTLSLMLLQMPVTDSEAADLSATSPAAQPPAPPAPPAPTAPFEPLPERVERFPDATPTAASRVAATAPSLPKNTSWQLDVGLGQARIRSRSARWLAVTEPFVMSVVGARELPVLGPHSAAVLTASLLGGGAHEVAGTALNLNVFELGAGVAVAVPKLAFLKDWLVPYGRLCGQLAIFHLEADTLADTALSASVAGALGFRADLGRRRLWHLFAEAGYVARLPRALALSPDDDDEKKDALAQSEVPVGTLHLSGFEAKLGVGLSF